MANPERYFSDTKEVELASLVWQVAGQRMITGETEAFLTPQLLAIPAFPDVRQMIFASDLITANRGDGEDKYNYEICHVLSKPTEYFSSKEVGVVEHFYRAALLAHVISPAGSAGASLVYDMALDPLFKKPIILALES